MLLFPESAADAGTGLAAAYGLAKPGAEVLVISSLKLEELQTSVILAGWVDGSVRDPQVFSAKKPTWEVGAVASVSLKKPTAKPAMTWKLAADDIEDEDLIDEDSLLSDLPKKTAVSASVDDCETGAKKRACKNCSCGRAEKEAGEEKPQMTEEELEESVSACGNCYKGDAFRCGGCPFLGKPAFEPGQEKVMLKLD